MGYLFQDVVNGLNLYNHLSKSRIISLVNRLRKNGSLIKGEHYKLNQQSSLLYTDEALPIIKKAVNKLIGKDIYLEGITTDAKAIDTAINISNYNQPLNTGILKREKKDTYVYALLCPTTFEPKYVGITTNIDTRFSQHSKGRDAQMNKQKKEWTQELTNQSLNPIMAILEKTTYVKKDEREVYWINFLSAKGYKLFNILNASN